MVKLIISSDLTNHNNHNMLNCQFKPVPTLEQQFKDQMLLHYNW